VRDQDDVYAIEFALTSVGSGPAGPSMGLGDAIDGR
jgi:hypothetical protein